ncbi:hypothetical protein QVD17_34644 [Tagetes erecta]|uniref:Uncharacterized protein n=1 Tax=Tagetes erecta TaxID=13708 RepID=A0AAD8NLR8_TARER|nr:hypothetical protein QVD17_34644 [Tagetes erecta]
MFRMKMLHLDGDEDDDVTTRRSSSSKPTRPYIDVCLEVDLLILNKFVRRKVKDEGETRHRSFLSPESGDEDECDGSKLLEGVLAFLEF